MPARNIFLSVVILIITGFVAHLQTTGKFGLTIPSLASLFFGFGCVNALLIHQASSQKRNSYTFLFTAFSTLCLFFLVYFINRKTDSSPLLMAAVHAGCFLLPFIILENWHLYKTAFQPAEISPWLLPVPYVKSNAISLHLNSIPFTFRIVAPNRQEQDYPVTAPGIKTLGMVFSELVYEDKTTEEPFDFSDIIDSSQGWVFYARELGGLKVRQLDANLSLFDNRLKNNAVIIVQHY